MYNNVLLGVKESLKNEKVLGMISKMTIMKINQLTTILVRKEYAI